MLFDIDDIRRALQEDNIQWSGHVLTKMQQREIKVKDVIKCVLSWEIIEYYSSDYPFPSCLIAGRCDNDKVLHVVCSLGEGNVWMITAYYPNTNEWLEDFNTRKR